MIAHAAIIGRSHRLTQHNCQDAAFTAVPLPRTAVGLVLDGCGSKYRDETGAHPSHNEVGAQLLGNILIQTISQQLAAAVPVIDCLHEAYCRARHVLIHLIEALPGSTADKQRFLMTNLLCTVVGFVVTQETAVCFWRGDGWLLINHEAQPLDSDNRPNYLAYDIHRTPPIPGFNLLQLTAPGNLHTLAVATDGWSRPLLAELNQPRRPLVLQRWLNVQAREHDNFEDDGAVAIWHKETED